MFSSAGSPLNLTLAFIKYKVEVFPSFPLPVQDVVHIIHLFTTYTTLIMAVATPLTETEVLAGMERLDGGWTTDEGVGWVPHRISQYRPPQLPAPASSPRQADSSSGWWGWIL